MNPGAREGFIGGGTRIPGENQQPAASH